jgi:hypothetical protein
VTVARVTRCALLLAITLPVIHAQQPAAAFSPATPTFSFSFERPGVPVPSYILVIAQDGTGRYAGTETGEPARASDPPLAPQPFGREFNVSRATANKIASLARDLHNFNMECASKAKNIADTGKKRLSYMGPDGQGSCTYNYTENKDVQALTDLFQGIAEAMDEGRRLDLLRRFDRLGLDAAVTFLAQQATDGRALELETIAPSLRAIADDAEVMQRVRTKAATLLAGIPTELRQTIP